MKIPIRTSSVSLMLIQLFVELILKALTRRKAGKEPLRNAEDPEEVQTEFDKYYEL